MIDQGRRSVLASTGGLLSSAFGGNHLPVIGAARGGRSASRSEAPRFIVDTCDGCDREVGNLDLEVVHSLEQIDHLVVRGAESEVRRLGARYFEETRLHPSPIGERGRNPPPRATLQNEETLFPLQWDKQAMNVPDVHDVTRGAETTVAIMDSGVQADHPNIAHALDLDRSRNFTNDGLGVGRALGSIYPAHGTEIGGIIAADPAGGQMLGTAPETDVLDCRVFAPGQGAWPGDYLAAIVFAADHGCDVANLSLGPALGTPRETLIFNRFTSSRIAEYAADAGMLLVVAAGNYNVDLRRNPLVGFLNMPNVMVISATGPIGFGWPINDLDGGGQFDSVEELEDPTELERPVTEPAVYSNYGQDIINVSAPGGNYDPAAQAEGAPGWILDTLAVPTTVVRQGPNGEYQFENRYGWTHGTSYAAPQVAAAAALVKSVNPDLGPSEIRQTIENTASDVREIDSDPFHGHGFLDPVAAVEAAR